MYEVHKANENFYSCMNLPLIHSPELITFIRMLKMLTSVCSCVEVCSSQLTRLYGHCGWHCVTHSLYVVVGACYIYLTISLVREPG
jgi:hypothetical protein